MVLTWNEEYKQCYVVVVTRHVEILYHSLDSRIACCFCLVYRKCYQRDVAKEEVILTNVRPIEEGHEEQESDAR